MKTHNLKNKFSFDPDELQILDELDSAWVEKWKLAAVKPDELEVRVLCQVKCPKILK